MRGKRARRLEQYFETIGMEELKSDEQERSEQVQELLEKFPENLDPSHRFWRTFSKRVRDAFPKGLAEDSELARLTHQFRYIISAQQVMYIRKHFKQKGDSDAGALARYAATVSSWTTSEPERFHQKCKIGAAGEKIYPDGTGGPNIKILFNHNFHTEFILDSRGYFLYILDETGNINGILNGSSFNYAKHNDAVHRKLDIQYGNHDPIFRKEANIDEQGKKIYISPSKDDFRKEGFFLACEAKKKLFCYKVWKMKLNSGGRKRYMCK